MSQTPAITDAQLAEWASITAAATAGPWACDMRLTDGQRAGDVHYSLHTEYNHPDHPHSPRFIAWFCGSVVTDAGPHVRASGKRVTCDRPGCDNWRYATREVGVDLRRDPQIEADGKFLAVAREAMPALLEEVRWLRASQANAIAVVALAGIGSQGQTLVERVVELHAQFGHQIERADKAEAERDALRRDACAIMVAEVKARFTPERPPTENERHLLNLLAWRESENAALREQLASRPAAETPPAVSAIQALRDAAERERLDIEAVATAGGWTAELLAARDRSAWLRDTLKGLVERIRDGTFQFPNLPPDRAEVINGILRSIAANISQALTYRQPVEVELRQSLGEIGGGEHIVTGGFTMTVSASPLIQSYTPRETKATLVITPPDPPPGPSPAPAERL